jgi:predicted dehydrogenase
MPRDVGDEIFFLPKGKPELRMTVRMNDKVVDPRGPYQRQLEDFVHASQTGAPPRVPGAEGLLSLKLMQQLYQNRKALPGGATSRG